MDKSKLETLLQQPYSGKQTLFDAISSGAIPKYGIYGAGSWGKEAHSMCTKFYKKPPLFITDRNPNLWGKRLWGGINVINPAEIEKNGEGICILVAIETASLPDSMIREEVIKTLNTVGVAENTVFFLQNSDFISFAFSADGNKHYNDSVFPELETVYFSLANVQSRLCLLEYIRMHKDKDIYRLPTVVPQYFLGDLFELRQDEIVADCGAYDGSTLTSIFRYYPSVKHVHSFEPNPDSFAALSKMVSRLNPEQRECVSIYPNAVDEKSGVTTFSMSLLDPEGSAISADGEISVETVSLDDVFTDKQPPTLIKMDVEGAELRALNGAMNTIERNRPILGICLYHRPQDIWEIPQWFLKHCPDYDFFICKHNPFRYHELVAYAIPQERRT